MHNHFEIIKSKIISGNDLDRALTILRFRGNKIVFTNGCFDIMHLGHVEYLAKAAAMGDSLILGLNTDASVKRLKGPERPVQNEETRAMVLAAMEFITHVVLFDEETPFNLIKQVQPDVLVKGGDYKIEEIVGYDIVTANGGKVCTIDLVEGHSTTGLIKKIHSK